MTAIDPHTSDYRRSQDDPAAFALLQAGCVEPQIWPLVRKRAVEHANARRDRSTTSGHVRIELARSLAATLRPGCRRSLSVVAQRSTPSDHLRSLPDWIVGDGRNSSLTLRVSRDWINTSRYRTEPYRTDGARNVTPERLWYWSPHRDSTRFSDLSDTRLPVIPSRWQAVRLWRRQFSLFLLRFSCGWTPRWRHTGFT